MIPDKLNLIKLENDEMVKRGDWYEMLYDGDHLAWNKTDDLSMTVEEYKNTEFKEYLVQFKLDFYREV